MHDSKELAMHLHVHNIHVPQHTLYTCNYHWYPVGSLVMEHPGTHPLPIQGKPTIFGGVNGSIGMIHTCNCMLKILYGNRVSFTFLSRWGQIFGGKYNGVDYSNTSSVFWSTKNVVVFMTWGMLPRKICLTFAYINDGFSRWEGGVPLNEAITYTVHGILYYQPLVIIPCMVQESSFSLSHLCLSCSVDWKRRCHVSSNRSAILNMKCILPCQIIRMHDCVVKEVHVAIPHKG